MNQKVILILDQLKMLSLLEATDLVKQMEDTFGINTATVGNFAMPSPLSGPLPSIIEVLEEKVTFDIWLNEVPVDKKIPILKVIRNITGFGLKESKEIVDNVPKLIKEGISKEDSEKVKKELEDAGAIISMK